MTYEIRDRGGRVVARARSSESAHRALRRAGRDAHTLNRRVAAIKSNDRMPARTRDNVASFVADVRSMRGPHRARAARFVGEVTPERAFEILHAMRRWYSGQTMARALRAKREILASVMDLAPADAVGIYRGFKVPVGSDLASASVGDRIALPVTRNHGFSSWSIREAETNRFSGGGRGKVGLIVRLVDAAGVVPVLAPPERTRPWFDAFYSQTIGRSFRPKEGEYLIYAQRVRVEVVRVKR